RRGRAQSGHCEPDRLGGLEVDGQQLLKIDPRAAPPASGMMNCRLPDASHQEGYHRGKIEFIARSTKMPRSIGRLSASALSHHGLSSVVFITNIAESDFRRTHCTTLCYKGLAFHFLRT